MWVSGANTFCCYFMFMKWHFVSPRLYVCVRSNIFLFASVFYFSERSKNHQTVCKPNGHPGFRQLWKRRCCSNGRVSQQPHLFLLESFLLLCSILFWFRTFSLLLICCPGHRLSQPWSIGTAWKCFFFGIYGVQRTGSSSCFLLSRVTFLLGCYHTFSNL